MYFAVRVPAGGIALVAVAGSGMQTPWGWTADNLYQFDGPNGQINKNPLAVARGFRGNHASPCPALVHTTIR